MYPLNIGPYVLGQTNKVTPIFVSSGVLITIIGIAMVRLGGALGGAIALLVVYAIQAFLLAKLSQRLYPVRFERRRVAKALGALAAAFLLVRSFQVVAPESVMNWLRAPLFLAIAAFALIAFRFPEPTEISALRAAAARIVRAE
jgi:hypothetical protein